MGREPQELKRNKILDQLLRDPGEWEEYLFHDVIPELSESVTD